MASEWVVLGEHIPAEAKEKSALAYITFCFYSLLVHYPFALDNTASKQLVIIS